MRKTRFLLAITVLILVTTLVRAQQHKFDVEVWAPQGMPFEIKWQFREPNIIGITKVIAADARKVSMLAVPLDENGEPTRGTQVMRYRMLTDRPGDLMTWGSADPRIKRLVLILEWVEYDNGKWVIDAPYIKFPEVDDRAFSQLRAFIKAGKENVPAARFEPTVLRQPK